MQLVEYMLTVVVVFRNVIINNKVVGIEYKGRAIDGWVWPGLYNYISYTYWSYSQMRGGFDLQHAQFSDDSEEQIKLPDSSRLEMYNQEYLLVLGEAKNFFADCKNCISRLLAFNTMDFGFNLPFTLTTVISMQNKWLNQKRKTQQPPPNHRKKQEYSQSFYSLLRKMGDLVGELIDLQVDIKKNYMGITIQKPQRRTHHQYPSHPKKTLKSTDSGSSTDLFKKHIKQSMLQEQEQKNQENEQKIRGILKKHMANSNQTPNSVCKMRVEPLENLERLASKLDDIKCKIKGQKQREQKVWENFNKRKPSCQQNPPEKQKKLRKFKETRILDDSISVESQETISNLTKNTTEKQQESIFCT